MHKRSRLPDPYLPPLLAAASLAALVALPACSRREPPAPARAVRIGIHGDPISLDPHLQNEVLTFAVLGNVFEGLTDFDRDLKLSPSLAASWSSPDDLTWVFSLREGARFHDGRSVEADDVVASLERVRRHPRSGIASYAVEIQSVTAVDPRTVRIRTRRPFGGLLNKLAYLLVVPRDTPEEGAPPLGSGPYRIVSYEPGAMLRMEPAEGAPTGLPPLEFVPVRDRAERSERLLSGRLDLVQDLALARVPQVEASPCCRAVAQPSPVVEYLHFLSTDPRFSDPRVRLAIDLAIDRAALVETAFAGYAQPASQIVGPGVFGYDAGIPITRRDLSRSRRLLAEAGHERGLDLTLEHREGRDPRELVRQLAEAGVRVTAVSSPWPDLFARLSARKIPFYYGGVSAPSADASDIFDSFVHSRDAVWGYGRSNHSDYRNPEVDALVERIAETSDLRERKAFLQRGLRLLREDRRLLPLVNPYDVYGVSEALSWQPRFDRRLLGVDMRWGEAAGRGP